MLVVIFVMFLFFFHGLLFHSIYSPLYYFYALVFFLCLKICESLLNLENIIVIFLLLSTERLELPNEDK